MYVTSVGIVGGVIADRFGKRGDQVNGFGKVTYSLPFEIHEPPVGTTAYAFVLEDIDAVPVCGFSWIHWVGANLTRTVVRENESLDAVDFVQGANSWISPLAGSHSREEASFYGGMAPPDRPHTYELHVFALDSTLPLARGFTLNELHWAMQNHVLDHAVIAGRYDA